MRKNMIFFKFCDKLFDPNQLTTLNLITIRIFSIKNLINIEIY